jgi:hypothetical protein
MSGLSYEDFRNPAAIAEPSVHQLMLDSNMGESTRAVEEYTICGLEKIADSLDLLEERYYVKASRGVQLPVWFGREDGATRFKDYVGPLRFEGELITYGIVNVDQVIGGYALHNMVCLAFKDIMMALPRIKRTPDDELMYVPIFAVDDMQRMD